MEKLYSRLLRVELPRGSLNSDVDPSQFFDRAEQIGKSKGWRRDRRRNYAGAGYDHLNLHIGPDASAPILRMVSTPTSVRKIHTEVVSKWKSGGPDYSEYVRVLRHAARMFLSEYNGQYGTSIRLGIPRKPLEWDPSTLDCDQLEYVRDKFDEAVRTLALGEGDMRKRLESAYLTLHVVQSQDLPEPLRPHWSWIVKVLTHRPARHRFEGTLHATLSQMKNSTAAKIAERIYEIRGALNELCPNEYYWMTD